MLRKILILVISFVFFIGTAVNAQAPTYVGSVKCKMCHNKETTGNQFKIWSESAHASAWKNLSGDKALEVGKKLGIAEPQKSEKCLKCHGSIAGFVEEGTTCEACHGPGSAYKTMAIMKDREMAKKNGLIIPDEKTCVRCHNSESPTFKSFDFATYYKKIEHPLPKK